MVDICVQSEHWGEWMKPCRVCLTSKIGKIGIVLALYPVALLLFVVGLILVGYAIIEIQHWCYIFGGLVSISVGIYLIYAGKKLASFEKRKYAISEEGLSLNDKQETFYQWEQIHEIGIYAFDANAAQDRYDTVICCFLAPRPDNFLSKILSNPFMYGQRNQEKFVIIDYSESAYEELSTAYPNIIKDFRQEQNRTFVKEGEL